MLCDALNCGLHWKSQERLLVRMSSGQQNSMKTYRDRATVWSINDASPGNPRKPA